MIEQACGLARDGNEGGSGSDEASSGVSPPRFLIDTYSGCGLFALSGAKHFERVLGIEVTERQVELARQNAVENGINNAAFVSGSAEGIFAHASFEGRHSAVILDPPRRGCDVDFLAQLLRFAPRRIVYVSCGPDTQARDLKVLIAAGYSLRHITPVDLFPHTRHVEAVATLEWPDPTAAPAPSPLQVSKPVSKPARKGSARGKGRGRRKRPRSGTSR